MIACCVCDFHWQVLATHQYAGEDEDELSFDKGAVIYVVPYEDPEDEVSPRIWRVTAELGLQ